MSDIDNVVTDDPFHSTTPNPVPPPVRENETSRMCDRCDMWTLKPDCAVPGKPSLQRRGRRWLCPDCRASNGRGNDASRHRIATRDNALRVQAKKMADDVAAYPFRAEAYEPDQQVWYMVTACASVELARALATKTWRDLNGNVVPPPPRLRVFERVTERFVEFVDVEVTA